MSSQRLTPIKFLYYKNYRAYWLFKCLCGKEIELKLNAYKTNNTKSCGCLVHEPDFSNKIKNEIGKIYNRLTLINRIRKPNKLGVSQIYYECLCICGNKTTVLGAQIRNNNTKSCGCLDRDTLIKRNKNPEFVSRRADKVNKKYKIEHWKTGKIVYCTGSWEYGVVKYFNENLIDFTCQIPFKLTDTTYICDFHLTDSDIYVEVKGRWIGDAKEKIELFKKTFPELKLEIWERIKLFSLGIINNQGVLKLKGNI